MRLLSYKGSSRELGHTRKKEKGSKEARHRFIMYYYKTSNNKGGTLEALSDFELIRRTREGYIEAFSILVQRYHKPLMILSMRYTNDIYSAEDVVQDSFLKAFEKLSTFQFRSAFKSWMYRIVVNTAKNKLRGKKYMVDIDDVVIPFAAVSELTVIERQLARQVKELVDQLPDKQRQALELRVYKDKTFKEVASDMDCPYDTAKANYRHGLLKIREQMAMEA